MSFGQVVEFAERNGDTEVVILPFDKKMSRLIDDGWLQWSPEECIKISRLMYCCLGLVWPLLWLVYRKSLNGQSTDYERTV